MVTSNEVIISGFDEEYDKSLALTLEQVDSIPKCLCVYLRGSIDSYNATFFEKKLSKILEAGFVNIIFGCATLTYVSSTGIGVFVSYFTKFRDVGGNIVFLDLQPKVYELFQILGFSHFFVIRKTISEAVEFYKEEKIIAETKFPKAITCPICNVRLRASRAGKFRCSKCKTVIEVNDNGKVSLP